MEAICTALRVDFDASNVHVDWLMIVMKLFNFDS